MFWSLWLDYQKRVSYNDFEIFERRHTANTSYEKLLIFAATYFKMFSRWSFSIFFIYTTDNCALTEQPSYVNTKCLKSWTSHLKGLLSLYWICQRSTEGRSSSAEAKDFSTSATTLEKRPTSVDLWNLSEEKLHKLFCENGQCACNTGAASISHPLVFLKLRDFLRRQGCFHLRPSGPSQVATHNLATRVM